MVLQKIKAFHKQRSTPIGKVLLKCELSYKLALI